MNLENVRSSFVVYNLDHSEERVSLVVKSLMNREFNVFAFTEADKVVASLEKNPPHILFANIRSILSYTDNFLHKVQEVSPETRVIITSGRNDFTDAYKFFEDGVFDYIFSDYFDVDSGEFEASGRFAVANILKAADHAVEMDYFKFKNEQLSDNIVEKNSSTSSSAFVLHNIWLQKLDKSKNFTASIDCFMDEISRFTKSSEMIYLKYVSSYKSLVTARAINIEDFTVGETFDLKPILQKNSIYESNFESDPEFRQKIGDYTDWNHFSIVPLKVNGILRGLFVLHTDTINEVNSYVLACINSLALKVSNLVLERKLHTINHKDEITDLYNRKYLMGRLKDEVSRARRIHLPISFLLISFDNFGIKIEDLNQLEVDAVLRLIAKLLDQTSRINDIVGRISSDEYGIILPHTPFHGALVKAERIRDLIATTDFSIISPKINKVTVSLGVSEYPSHCRDVEDMLEMADKAMLQGSRIGGNQVCLSSAPKNFEPDFFYK